MEPPLPALADSVTPLYHVSASKGDRASSTAWENAGTWAGGCPNTWRQLRGHSLTFRVTESTEQETHRHHILLHHGLHWGISDSRPSFCPLSQTLHSLTFGMVLYLWGTENAECLYHQKGHAAWQKTLHVYFELSV